MFDTKLLNDLLNKEFESYCYTQTTYSNVVYNTGIGAFEASFSALIKEASWFLWKGLYEIYDRAEEFINDFIKTTVSFKHSMWSEEREVRIVAHPKHPSELKYISETDSDEIKALRTRGIKDICHVGDRPFIKLFETLGVDLPIKRIIVAPDEEQERLWQQATILVDGRVPVHRSKVAIPTTVM